MSITTPEEGILDTNVNHDTEWFSETLSGV